MLTFQLRIVLPLLFSLLFGVIGSATASEALPTVRVGIITDGPIMREHTFLNLIKDELRGSTSGSFTVEFPPDATVYGNWGKEGREEVVDDLLSRTDLNVVIALGIGVGAEICERTEISTPVVVPFLFPNCSTGCSQQSVFQTRSIDMRDVIARDLRAFHDLIAFSRVAILLDPSWPANCNLDDFKRQSALQAVTIDFITVETADSEVGQRLHPETDAVYLMPMFQLDDAAFETLVSDLTARGLPTFSMIGEEELENGVFAAVNTRAAMSAIARGTALDLLDASEGREISDPVARELGGKLTLNMKTAQALGFDPSWELLTRVRLVHDQNFWRDRPIDLATAMRRAVDANLDLAVNERRVAADAEEIRDAQSNYRPQLSIGLGGAVIDENHAMGALGQYAKSASGSLTLNQLIYSDAASSNISIQKDLHRARLLDSQALRLDIARDAVAAYMDVMRTNALIEVRRDQVDLTSTNLELARLRHTLGTSGAVEVHRWEAELATARAGLLQALSQHRQTERQLSRLLDEDLTTRWSIREVEIDTSLETLGGAEMIPRLGGATGYTDLALSLMNEGIERAPELAALQTMIGAQERLLTSTERASYVPTVGLQANVAQVFAKDETSGIDLGDFADLIPELDDTSWSVGVQASVPILTGGKNKARQEQTRQELQALRIDHENVSEKLSQRTLSALDAAIASWSSIELRRQAADAATKTLDLVRDAYVRGSASILGVLDAQNSAIRADLAARTAIYDFLDDWAEVRRSVARLDTTSSR